MVGCWFLPQPSVEHRRLQLALLWLPVTILARLILASPFRYPHVPHHRSVLPESRPVRGLESGVVEIRARVTLLAEQVVPVAVASPFLHVGFGLAHVSSRPVDVLLFRFRPEHLGLELAVLGLTLVIHDSVRVASPFGYLHTPHHHNVLPESDSVRGLELGDVGI